VRAILPAELIPISFENLLFLYMLNRQKLSHCLRGEGLIKIRIGKFNKLTLSHKQVDFSLKGTTNFYFNLKTQFEKNSTDYFSF